MPVPYYNWLDICKDLIKTKSSRILFGPILSVPVLQGLIWNHNIFMVVKIFELSATNIFLQNCNVMATSSPTMAVIELWFGQFPPICQKLWPHVAAKYIHSIPIIQQIESKWKIQTIRVFQLLFVVTKQYNFQFNMIFYPNNKSQKSTPPSIHHFSFYCWLLLIIVFSVLQKFARLVIVPAILWLVDIQWWTKILEW